VLWPPHCRLHAADVEANKELYRRYIEDLWNKKDPATPDRYLAPDYVDGFRVFSCFRDLSGKKSGLRDSPLEGDGLELLVPRHARATRDARDVYRSSA
jgi:hypothetical protein